MEVEPDKKNQMSKQGTDYIDTDLPHDRPTVPQNQSFLGSIMEGTPSNFFLQKVGFVITWGRGLFRNTNFFPLNSISIFPYVEILRNVLQMYLL